MKIEMLPLLQRAQKGHYAIPAANFINWQTAQAYVAASEQTDLPLILAFAQVHTQYLTLEDAAAIGRYFQAKSTTPIVLHLDHGQDIDFIEQAIELGFNSVMIDASQTPFEDNVRITREVIDLARPKGVAVEAEIGFVGANSTLQQSGEQSIYTTVEQAQSFVQQTHVDTLAVSIGTAHGLYHGTPQLNFERLAAIRKQISTPLVLHGGSSSGDANLKRCANLGITKINLYSDFLAAGWQATQHAQTNDYLTLQQAIRHEITRKLTHYYRVFGTQA